jgi:hypothetical protein
VAGLGGRVGRIEQVALGVVSAQPGRDAGAERGVAGAGPIQVGVALGGRGLLQGGSDEGLLIHGWARSGVWGIDSLEGEVDATRQALHYNDSFAPLCP